MEALSLNATDRYRNVTKISFASNNRRSYDQRVNSCGSVSNAPLVIAPIQDPVAGAFVRRMRGNNIFVPWLCHEDILHCHITLEEFMQKIKMASGVWRRDPFCDNVRDLEITSVVRHCTELSENLIAPPTNCTNGNAAWHVEEISRIVQKHGGYTPKTVLTNSVPVSTGCGSLIAKAAGNVPSYTIIYDPHEHTIEAGIVLIQNRIRGDEWRVHLIDRKFVAHRIHADGIDYRKTSENIQFEEGLIGQNIVAALHELCDVEGMRFAGVDLIWSGTEQFVVLEANPMPGYTSYEEEKKHPVTLLLYEALCAV